MILSFTFENFKSFSDRTSVSFLARKADRTLSGALIDKDRGFIGKDRLLPAIAVYGANASGKTNFLLALYYVRLAVNLSQTLWKRGTGTRYDPNMASKLSSGFFEIVFQLSGVTYRYGFTVNSSHFESEWLYSYPKNRERMLFKRNLASFEKLSDKDGRFEVEYELEVGPSFSGDKREHESSFRRTRENSLFLSAAAQDNQKECVELERWFRGDFVTEIELNVNELDQGLTSILAYRHKKFKTLLLPLLRAADSCIVDIVVTKKQSDKDADSSATVREESKDYKVSFVSMSNGRRIELPFQKQSRGIKRLYALSAALVSALKFGKVFVIDELETSMHSQVASQLLALFQNRSSNPMGAQLIFTTHETRLLNLQHLRRDQVWFCEKNDNGQSSLFSLLEFAPRKDENFETGYLRGRYGAVPQAGIDPVWLSAINDRQITLETGDQDA